MKSYLFNRLNIGTLAASILLLLLSEGCSSDTDDTTASGSSPTEESSEAVVRVPITIALGGYDEAEEEASSSEDGTTSDEGTRSAPPGAGSSTPSNSTTSDDKGYEETQSINTVRVIAFRRKAKTENEANEESSDDTEGFEYDPNNDITLTTLTDEYGHTDDYLSGTSHKHRVAKGTFAKSKGYEYRIVALAYDTEEKFPYPEYSPYWKVINDYTIFNIGKGTTYDDFKVDFRKALVTTDSGDKKGNWRSFIWGNGITTHNSKCLSDYLASIPQLFYGFIYQKGDKTKSPIIPYSTTDNDNKIVTNTSLTGTLYRGMAEVVLNLKTGKIGFANPLWYCLMADNVLTTVNLTSYDDFNHGYNTIADGKYTAIAYHSTPSSGETITLKAFLLPGKTHLAVRGSFHMDPYAQNGQIKAKDVTSSDNATGVITVNALNNVFYLRRNHKYVFTYTDHSVIMGKSHEIE